MVDVSVVIPTRNRGQFLRTALKSALAQQAVTSEVIVVDDASFQAVDPAGRAGVEVARHPTSRGVSAARNTGIARARGAWIAFLDDDDLWAPSKLVRQLTAATDADRGWAYAGYVDVDASLRLVGGVPPAAPEEVMDKLQHHNSVPAGASNVVVRSSTLERAGGFADDLGMHEDWDLWLRLARLGPPACVDEPLVALRWHHGNVSSQLASMDQMLRDLPRIAERNDVRVDYARHLRWAAWTALTAGSRRDAVRWYLSAAARGDLRSLGRAALVAARPQDALRRTRPLAASNGWAAAAETWLRELR
jgi:GT2 family glycosyltransferase